MGGWRRRRKTGGFFFSLTFAFLKGYCAGNLPRLKRQKERKKTHTLSTLDQVRVLVVSTFRMVIIMLLFCCRSNMLLSKDVPGTCIYHVRIPYICMLCMLVLYSFCWLFFGLLFAVRHSSWIRNACYVMFTVVPWWTLTEVKQLTKAPMTWRPQAKLLSVQQSQLTLNHPSSKETRQIATLRPTTTFNTLAETWCIIDILFVKFGPRKKNVPVVGSFRYLAYFSDDEMMNRAGAVLSSHNDMHILLGIPECCCCKTRLPGTAAAAEYHTLVLSVIEGRLSARSFFFCRRACTLYSTASSVVVSETITQRAHLPLLYTLWSYTCKKHTAGPKVNPLPFPSCSKPSRSDGG